jgi:23S rRNA (guanine745-N1)-methyltransferase
LKSETTAQHARRRRLDRLPTAGEAVFACPVCGEPLQGADPALRCVNGHTFDVAREGYVNLLLAQHRHSTDPGYSREMIAGRRTFLEAGHYEALADGIADLIISHLPDVSAQVVVDAGCGEGYYLRRLRARLAVQSREVGAVLCGIDISSHAIRAAARLDQRSLYAVASSHRMPLLPNRADLLLTHFSPVSGADFRRVVRPGGVVLVGGPGERHLFSLKELLYDAPAPHRPHAPLADEPGLELIAVHRIRYEIALRGTGQVANLLVMTPFYWSVNEATQRRLAALEALDTEVDVVVHAYRRRQDRPSDAGPPAAGNGQANSGSGLG